MKVLWIVAGLVCVAVGAVGVVVPGLPTTVFFVMAAWCFSRSSPRLERWLLGLPGIGRLVSDFRAGRGMPLRAKYVATLSISTAVAVSAGLMIDPWWVRVTVVALGAFGVWYIWTKVPTASEPADRDQLTP